MKRYIISSEAFDRATTDTSYYDNFLNPEDLKYMQEAKNLTGEVVMMTPSEYYQRCADDIFDGQLKNNLIRQRDNDYSAKYVEDMKNGDVFPLPYLNYRDKSQEGLHRMLAAARAFGWNVPQPVLVVDVYDKERQRKLDKIREFRDYENYEFREDVDTGIRDISDWSQPVPDDVEIVIKDAVEKAAESNGHDISVDVEIKEINNGHKVYVWLEAYNGYEPECLSAYSDNWLEDMFDMKDNTSYSDDIDEIDDLIDDMDLEDLLR